MDGLQPYWRQFCNNNAACKFAHRPEQAKLSDTGRRVERISLAQFKTSRTPPNESTEPCHAPNS
jgi:hypothetical protein